MASSLPVIAFVHGPFYNSNHAHQHEVATETLRRAAEPIFHQHLVAAVWSGHVHAYERSHPVFEDKVESCGATYVTIGDAGNAEGLEPHWFDPPSYSAFTNGKHYGRGDIFVANETHLR